MSCVWGVGFTWSTSGQGQQAEGEEDSRDRNDSGNTRVTDEGERGGGVSSGIPVVEDMMRVADGSPLAC